MAGGFQTAVSTVPAPGVEGDFCSLNVFYTVNAGPGGLVAGASGVIVGRFAWTENNALDPDNAPTIVNNFGSGTVTGFVHREQQGLITTYLADATLTVPHGFPVTLMSGGDFWVKNAGSTQALIGQKAYANFTNGAVTFGATATPTTGASSSSSGSLAPETVAITGSISGNVLTVTVTAGAIYPGSTITSGAGVASGTMISAQLTGTALGVGTYALSIPSQTVASEAMTLSYTLFTAGTVTLGVFGVGDVISGTSVTTGSYIAYVISGGGTTGSTMVVSPYGQTITTTVILAAALNVETKWTAMSSGLAGELIKISSHPLG